MSKMWRAESNYLGDSMLRQIEINDLSDDLPQKYIIYNPVMEWITVDGKIVSWELKGITVKQLPFGFWQKLELVFRLTPVIYHSSTSKFAKSDMYWLAVTMPLIFLLKISCISGCA